MGDTRLNEAREVAAKICERRNLPCQVKDKEYQSTLAAVHVAQEYNIGLTMHHFDDVTSGLSFEDGSGNDVGFWPVGSNVFTMPSDIMGKKDIWIFVKVTQDTPVILGWGRRDSLSLLPAKSGVALVKGDSILKMPEDFAFSPVCLFDTCGEYSISTYGLEGVVCASCGAPHQTKFDLKDVADKWLL